MTTCPEVAQDSNMTYEKAAYALVDAGLLDQANARMAAAVLAWPSADTTTYPARASALARAGLLNEANLETAIDVMVQAGMAEAKDGRQGGMTPTSTQPTRS